MARIFLSHSSVDEIEAVALKHWLSDNGWGDEDVFLDIDPERGLAAGERWQEALHKAADRCEAVVFIISPAWAQSKWCLAEFLLAKSLHKLIFGVVLKEVAIGELPTEMTSEWQLCRLVGDGSKEIIEFSHRQQEQRVALLTDGLKRLKLGLQKAGLSAGFFPWPPAHDPDRAPYRGLQALDVDDAAVFFGRDVEIQRGLDALRGMRDSIDKKLFVILGASGAGKSSFLRAGLIPRLKRDDRHFFVLPVMRPQREPLSGGYGLVNSLHKARDELKLPPQNRGDILAQLKQGQIKLAEHLKALQDAARNRLVSSVNEGAPTPTLLLAVDQAEELFNADAGQEARDFLQLIGELLRQNAANQTLPSLIVFTVRSDRYEPLQTAPELASLQGVVFDDLKPMPPDRFREVILGPARRASVQGSKLDIKPDLVNQLLDDCSQGGDTLPLLSLTLATLHQDYGSDGDLRLDEYQSMGGITGIVKKEAEDILSTDPATREQQLKWLHAAFIPWLVTINPQNDQPMRRVAKLNELPAESRPLIEALAAKRLLVMDKKAEETVVEIAHEALLRQWDVLVEWLRIESNELRDAESLERAALAWQTNGRKLDWLIDGERLANAELLVAKAGFDKRFLSCKEFLRISRLEANARQEAEKKRQQAELDKERHLREAAEALARAEKKQREEAQRLQLNSLASSLASQAVLLAQGRRAQSDLPALLALQSHRFNEEVRGRERELVDRALRSVLDLPHFTEVLPNQEDVLSLALSHDARWLACGCAKGTFHVWDLRRTGPLWSALRTKPPTPCWTRSVHTAALIWVVAHPTRPIVTCVAEDGAAFLLHLERIDVSPLRLEAEAWVNRVEHVYHTCTEYPPVHVVYRHDGSSVFIAPGVGFDLTDVESCFDRDQPPARCDVSGGSGAYYGFSDDGKVMTSYVQARGYMVQTQEVHRDGIGVEPGAAAEAGDVVTLRGWYGGEPRREAISYCPCSISPDGRWVVQIAKFFTSTDSLKLWDVSGPAGERHPIQPAARGRFTDFSPPGGGQTLMVFDRDSRVFATLYQGSWIGVWDLRRPTTAPLMLGGWGKCSVAALSPGGRVMASVVRAGTQIPILVWPLAAADPSCAVLDGHRGGVQGLAFGPDGAELMTYGVDDTVRIWNLTGDALDPPAIDLTRYGAIAIPVLDEVPQPAYEPPRPPARRSGTPIAVASPDGRIAVAVVGRDGDQLRERVLVFRSGLGDPEPLVLQPPLENLEYYGVHSPVILSLRFGGEGDVLHVCEKLPVPESGASDFSGLGIVRLWDLSTTGAEPVTRVSSWGFQPQVALDDCGTPVSAYSMGGRERYNPNPRPTGVKVWDPADPDKPPRVLACAGDDFTAVAVGGGPWVCAAESTGVVWVWDRSQPDAEPEVRQAHFGPVRAVAFGPGDDLLAAGGDDGTIAVWSLSQPEARPILLSGHQEAVNCLAFSPDGHLLASGSDDGTVRLWIIHLDLLAGLVENRVQRNLTPTEWRRYVGPGVDYRQTCPDLPPGEDAPSSGAPLAAFAEPLKEVESPRLSQHEAKT